MDDNHSKQPISGWGADEDPTEHLDQDLDNAFGALDDLT